MHVSFIYDYLSPLNKGFHHRFYVIIVTHSFLLFKIFSKIIRAYPHNPWLKSSPKNELDDFVLFRTFGAQKSVENLKDNLTTKLIFWKSTSSLLLADA